MKRKGYAVFCFFCLIALSALISCSNLFNMLFEPITSEEQSLSSLVVKLNNGSSQDASRVIAPSINDLIYVISLYKGDTDLLPEVKSVTQNESVVFNKLTIGIEYIVRVKGKNLDGIFLLSGESSFTAVQGENSVSVQLSYTSAEQRTGTGSLFVEYTLSADVGNTIIPTLSPFDGGDDISFTGDEFKYNATTKKITLNKSGISSGTYILTLVYMENRIEYYMNIDPLVEIFPGFTSTIPDVPLLNVEDAIKSGLIYYVGDSSNSLVKADNTGYRLNQPMTLERALTDINSREDIIGENQAKIVVIENITVVLPETTPSAFTVLNKTKITSLGSVQRTITIGNNCRSLFIVGSIEEPAKSSSLELEYVTLAGALAVDSAFVTIESSSFSFDKPEFFASNGLVSVINGSLTLGYSVVIQDNVNINGKGGGVFINSSGKLIMSGGLIENCTADMGGGVYIADGGQLELNNGNIMYNCNYYDQAALQMGNSDFKNYMITNSKGSGVYFENLDFINSNIPAGMDWIQRLKYISSSNMHSGAGCATSIFYISDEQTLRDAVNKAAIGILNAQINSTVTEIVVSSPLMLEGNLIIKAVAGKVTIRKTYFDESLLRTYSSFLSEFENINFSGGNTIGTSALVDMQNTQVVFNNCEFRDYKNNTSFGGGLSLGYSTVAIINNSSFTNLTAHSGGAIYSDTANTAVTLNGVAISNCTAQGSVEEGGNGGGVCVESGHLILDGGSLIKGCKAQRNSGNGGYGGAVYINSQIYSSYLPYVILKDVSIGSNEMDENATPIMQNSAYKGAGAYVKGRGILDISSTNPFVSNGNIAFIDAENVVESYGNSFYIEDYSLESIQIDGINVSEFGSEGSTFTSLGINKSDINEYLFQGRGENGGYYQISSPNDIEGMKKVPLDILSKFFSQVNSIDMGEISTFNGIPFFNGTYNGNNYCIANLVINGSNTDSIGFFNDLNGATVSNLFIDNAFIESSNYGITKNYGLLAGKVVDSTITRCGSTGQFTQNNPVASNNIYYGGLIGNAQGTAISQCFSVADMLVDPVTGIEIGCVMGGLVGVADQSTIEDCYTSMEEINNIYTGGITGTLAGKVINNSKVSRCYSIGTVSGPGTKGFIGILDNSINSNTVMYTSGDIDGAIYKNSNYENMTHSNNFYTFGFLSGVWTIDDGSTHPYFSWHYSLYKPDYLRVIDVQYYNYYYGTEGVMQGDDTMVITYSCPVDASSINSSLSAGIQIDNPDLFLETLGAPSNAPYFGAISDTWNLGSFSIIGSVITPDSSTVQCKSINLSSDSRSLTLTFTEPTSQFFVSPIPSGASLTFIPAIIRSQFGSSSHDVGITKEEGSILF